MPDPLKQAIEDALQAYSPLRTSRSEVSVHMEDGRVTLSGYVPSSSMKRMAAFLAGNVEGVGEVVNQLQADPDLERSVAMALATDERTRRWPIRVRAENGYVQLQGYVPDPATLQAILDVARKVKGPRQIVNALKMGQPLRVAA
jgi:osmotically-inducible protein OsmY